MKLSEMKEAGYGVRLYKMPSDATIRREAMYGGGSFAELKVGYAALWKTRQTLSKQSNLRVD
jgi:hypothetical protein